MALNAEKILVADDQKTVRLVLEQRIRKMGYRPFLTSNGKEAWQMIQNEPFDLVILDCQMPGLTGIEVLKRIRMEPRFGRLPVIFFTDKDKHAEKEYVFALGANDYLVKSTGSGELEMRIRALLQRENNLKVVIDANLRETFRRSFRNYSNLQEMFASILPAVARLMNMESVIRSRIEDGTSTIENIFEREATFVSTGSFPLGDTFCSKVAETRAPVFIGDATQSDEWKDSPFRLRMGIISYIGIPLFVKNKLYGTLSAYSKSSRKFDDFSIELMQLFAQKISYEIEREAMQQEIKLAQDALVDARSLSSMSRMTAAIAHEMRQPLVAADMDLAGLIDDLQELDAKELATSARSRIKETLLIIRTLMKTFRNKKQTTPSEIDLNCEIRDIVTLFTRKTKGVEVVYDMTDNSKISTTGNIGRIFVNIIGNALDALKNKGRLLLSTKLSGNLIVKIEDNGPGIPPEILEKIFDPEFTTKKAAKGRAWAFGLQKKRPTSLAGK